MSFVIFTYALILSFPLQLFGQDLESVFKNDTYEYGVSSFQLILFLRRFYKFLSFLSPQKYAKFTRVKCVRSNLTIPRGYCRIKPVHRYLNHLNMEFFFPKPFRPVFFSFNVSFRHQLGGTFRYVYGFKDLNACELTKMFVGAPLLKPIIDFANSTLLKGIIRECPYGPGYVRVENASIVVRSAFGFSQTHRFPNGDYKIDIRIFNKRDVNALSISLTLQSMWRRNAEEGNINF